MVNCKPNLVKKVEGTKNPECKATDNWWNLEIENVA
jgi:hypothetical protein